MQHLTQRKLLKFIYEPTHAHAHVHTHTCELTDLHANSHPGHGKLCNLQMQSNCKPQALLSLLQTENGLSHVFY